jgi:CRISPR-associated protein Cas1
MPRAKPDVLNILMDIGYTFLFNFIDALLRLYGFDTYKGIYHQLFFQRKSLACDLVEPFRCLIDKQILKSYHLRQIDKKDFIVKEGQVFLSYDKQQKYLQIFSECIMKDKEDVFKYIRDFYYFILNGGKKYPFFKLCF